MDETGVWIMGMIALAGVAWFAVAEWQDRREWKRILRETAAGRAQVDKNLRLYSVGLTAQGAAEAAQRDAAMELAIADAIVRNAREQAAAKRAALGD